MRDGESDQPVESGTQRVLIGRRRFVMAASAAGALLATLAFAPRLIRGALRSGTPRTAQPGGPLPAGMLSTTTTFLGSLFGTQIGDVDRAELLDRLSYSVDHEPSLGQDYIILVRHLDLLARARGYRGFGLAPAATRADVVAQLMKVDARGMLPRILGRISPSRHELNRIRTVTIPRLVWIYRHSGVPWRVRGYRRWPGIPGDWHEYLAAGNPYPTRDLSP